MSNDKILMATDVPFWRNRTGAQQRMLHLVIGLQKKGFAVRTFFVGVEADTDVKIAEGLSLDVEFHSSDRVPDGVRRRIKWHMEGTIHLVRQAFRGREDQEKVDQAMKLGDFRWPWAIDAFKGCVNRYEPEAIIFQYITMGYLIDGLSESQRQSIRCIVDTHDVLSDRQEQFEQFGYSHWIDVSSKEESSALHQFDAALAIIDMERPALQAMAPAVEVIVASHSIEPMLSEADKKSSRMDDALTVGYFGSSNHSNGHALVKFVRNVWQPLRSSGEDVRLVIAGSICDWLMFHEESRFANDESMSLWIELSTDPNVTLMGKVDAPSEFYQQIDIAINPVEFGTGLKIKTCEAFAWGVPSLVTECGAGAIPPEAATAVLTVSSINEMAPAIVAMIHDRNQLMLMKDAALHVAKSVFNDEVAYGGLCRWLRTV